MFKIVYKVLHSYEVWFLTSRNGKKEAAVFENLFFKVFIIFSNIATQKIVNIIWCNMIDYELLIKLHSVMKFFTEQEKYVKNVEN